MTYGSKLLSSRKSSADPTKSATPTTALEGDTVA